MCAKDIRDSGDTFRILPAKPEKHRGEDVRHCFSCYDLLKILVYDYRSADSNWGSGNIGMPGNEGEPCLLCSKLTHTEVNMSSFPLKCLFNVSVTIDTRWNKEWLTQCWSFILTQLTNHSSANMVLFRHVRPNIQMAIVDFYHNMFRPVILLCYSM